MKEEIEQCIKQALKVDFLTEQWEKERYAAALIEALKWGKKVGKNNERNSLKTMADKYNNIL